MRRIWMVFLLLILTQFAAASCILPIPDGDIPNTSDRNVAGKIVKIGRNSVFIKDVTSEKKVQIFLPKDFILFTAFGGDFSFESLAVGQSARVWLENCSRPNNNRGVAAYFEIYSTDINDKPEKSYFYKKGR